MAAALADAAGAAAEPVAAPVAAPPAAGAFHLPFDMVVQATGTTGRPLVEAMMSYLPMDVSKSKQSLAISGDLSHAAISMFDITLNIFKPNESVGTRYAALVEQRDG